MLELNPALQHSLPDFMLSPPQVGPTTSSLSSMLPSYLSTILLLSVLQSLSLHYTVGNLEDITIRAVNVLKECDLILAEDTRHSIKLMKHYGISTALSSFHEHNEWVSNTE